MRRNFIPIKMGNDRIFTIVVIVVLVALVGGSCSLKMPGWFLGGPSRASLETQHASVMMKLEQQIAQALTDNEVEILKLRLVEAQAEHKAKLEAIERKASVAAFVAPFWAGFRVAVGALCVAGFAGMLLVGFRVSRPMVQAAERRAWSSVANEAGQFAMIWARDDEGNLVGHNPNHALDPGVVLRLKKGETDIEAKPTTVPQIQAGLTVNSQDVQRTAAKYRNAPAIVKVGPGAQADDDPKAPTLQWPTTVHLRSLLRAQNGASLENMILGMTLDPTTGRQVVVKDSLQNLSHIGVGGSSGWGKTRALESLLYQLLQAPEKPDLAIIDLKRELSAFGQSDRLLYPVATSSNDGSAIFHELGDELERRLELFEQVGRVVSLDDFNERRGDHAPLAPIVCVADECTSLLRSGDKQLVSGIQRLALLGRSAGLLLILAAQNWKVSNAGGSETRDQLSSRMQFKCMSKSQSRLLIDSADAADLDAKGRAVCVLPGRERLELQSPLVSGQEIEQILTGQSGACQAMPTMEAQPVAKVDARAQEFIDAYNETGSVTGAAKAVFGGNGSGNNFYRVKGVLQSVGLV